MTRSTGAIALLLSLVGCAKHADLREVTIDGESFTTARVSGSSVTDCNTLDVDADGVVDGVVWGLDADGDGETAVPDSWTDIYAPDSSGVSQYLCVVSGGGPGGYDIALTDADVGTDCDDTNVTVTTASVAEYIDTDADGFGQTSSLTWVCGSIDPGWAAVGGDCDDTVAVVNPGATEACNGYDDDCDGSIDEAGATGSSTYYADADVDGYGNPAVTTSACSTPTGYLPYAGDCDDADFATFPGAAEFESTAVCMTDGDYDGYGDDSPVSGVTAGTDCDDGVTAVNPGVIEVTGDGVDNDCDATTLDAASTDADGDGYVAEVDGGDDCNDSDATIHPYATEVVGDGIDQDCGGSDLIPTECADAPPGIGLWRNVSWDGLHCNYQQISSGNWGYYYDGTTTCGVMSWVPTQAAGSTVMWTDTSGTTVRYGWDWLIP